MLCQDPTLTPDHLLSLTCAKIEYNNCYVIPLMNHHAEVTTLKNNYNLVPHNVNKLSLPSSFYQTCSHNEIPLSSFTESTLLQFSNEAQVHVQMKHCQRQLQSQISRSSPLGPLGRGDRWTDGPWTDRRTAAGLAVTSRVQLFRDSSTLPPLPRPIPLK